MQTKPNLPRQFPSTIIQEPDTSTSALIEEIIHNKKSQAPQGRGPAALGGSRRLHRKEAAPYLGVSLSWLDKARASGTGPPYIEIGSRVLRLPRSQRLPVAKSA